MTVMMVMMAVMMMNDEMRMMLEWRRMNQSEL